MLTHGRLRCQASLLLVVTTDKRLLRLHAYPGIGPTPATVCVYDVLARCGSLVKDVFYSGTSGWSPQLGGIINNGSCETGGFNKNNQIIR